MMKKNSKIYKTNPLFEEVYSKVPDWIKREVSDKIDNMLKEK